MMMMTMMGIAIVIVMMIMLVFERNAKEEIGPVQKTKKKTIFLFVPRLCRREAGDGREDLRHRRTTRIPVCVLCVCVCVYVCVIV
jgi:hypothetical protein